jgi:hypothetical protein
MKAVHKELLWALGMVAGLFMLMLYWDAAQASHYGDVDIDIDNSTTNNYYDQEAAGPTSITAGMSDKDLAAGLAMSMAAGSHQFDFSTQDNQLSVTYVIQIEDEEQRGYSIAYARRWDRLGQALLTVSYTPSQDDIGDYVVFGGTIRF